MATLQHLQHLLPLALPPLPLPMPMLPLAQTPLQLLALLFAH